jgi:hypothetical protein
MAPPFSHVAAESDTRAGAIQSRNVARPALDPKETILVRRRRQEEVS